MESERKQNGKVDGHERLGAGGRKYIQGRLSRLVSWGEWAKRRLRKKGFREYMSRNGFKEDE